MLLEEQTKIDLTAMTSRMDFLADGVIRASFTYLRSTGQVVLSAGNTTTLTIRDMEARLLALRAWVKKNKMTQEICWQNGGFREMSVVMETKNQKTTVVMKVENHAMLDLEYDQVSHEVTIPNRPERTLHADEFNEWLDHFGQWIVWSRRPVTV